MYSHLGVPYRAQWMSPHWVKRIVQNDDDPCEDPCWRDAGFADPTDYRFWSKRMCGIACLESVLAFWNKPAISRAAAVSEGLARGFYQMKPDGTVNGLIYAPFLDWVDQTFDLSGQIHTDIDIRTLADKIDERTVAVASVSPEIRAPYLPNQKQGGHLVLLTGCSNSSVRFHNPSGVGEFQSDVELPFEVFERFYARRGFTLHNECVD